jgi:hypothetical protein
MKVHRISTALSLTLLTALAVAPIAKAVGDPNIDSGVGSAASRGPFGFNHTGNAPIYDTPANDYGVWRDAYGGLRDAGMQPDNLTTRVPEPTWEDTHPVGPPVPSGAPGGLAAGGIGGGLGLGIAGLGAGLGFPLSGGFGSLGSFTGVSPISAAGAAALTNPLGVGGGTGLGPYSFPRTTFGFAGSPGSFLAGAPFTGQRYNGGGSGYIVTPSVTTKNVTASGVSTNTTTWNTTFGPAQFIQATSGPATGQKIVTTFIINGNKYSSTANGVPSTASPASVVDPNIANLLTMFGLNIPINMPAANSSITTKLTTANATTNPFLPAGTNFDPNAFIHNGSAGSIGGGWATPTTAGGQNGYFWTNLPGGNGNFGSSFATQATSGSPQSAFFGGSFGSTTIGGGYPTNATAGQYRSADYPNVDLGNSGGMGGGNLASVGFGLPGYGVPNVGVGFPGYSGGGGSTAAVGPGYAGGAAAAGAAGAYGGGGGFSNGALTAPNTSVYTSTQAGNGFNQAATTTTGTVTPSGGGSSFTQNVVTAPVNGVMSSTTSTTPGGTSTTNSFSQVFPPPVGSGAAPEGYVGPGPGPAVGGVEPGPVSSRVQPSTIAGARIDNGDGAYGFFGGTPAMVSAVMSGSEYGMPFIGNQTPLGAYAAATFLRTRREVSSHAAAGYGPIGNITTDLEPKLAAMHLTACQAIGSVIGSMRFANGDILTYGTNGTLRLAADNSGSITLNDGQILTFKMATPEVRAVALKSTVLF